MDETIGLVVKPDLKFIEPHFVLMSLGPDFESPKTKRIDLEKEVPRMKVEAILKYVSIN